MLLVHRIPYPPNKGDKIRSYHLFEYLSKKFDVYLAAFVDEPDDFKYKTLLERNCKGLYLEPLSPRRAKLASLRGFFSNQALTVPYYFSQNMRKWIKGTVTDNNIQKIVVFSSAMAQYVSGYLPDKTTKILDYVDIDSDKWKQYSKSQKWPYSWIYRRESEKLFRYESDMAKQFDLNLFVSRVEAELFQSMLDNADVPVSFYNNGVDIQYFDPTVTLTNPYYKSDRNEKIVVFTGAMDYWANVDGVVWFANDILPIVRQEYPDVKFYIVGGNPTAEVLALASDSVIVTGRVEDVRPYLRFADIAVAPLRIARGVQNKVLEAMAYNKPIVATEEAISGIEECPEFTPLIAKNAGEFAFLCMGLLKKSLQVNSRVCIEKYYDWNANLSIVGAALNTRNMPKDANNVI